MQKGMSKECKIKTNRADPSAVYLNHQHPLVPSFLYFPPRAPKGMDSKKFCVRGRGWLQGRLLLKVGKLAKDSPGELCSRPNASYIFKLFCRGIHLACQSSHPSQEFNNPHVFARRRQ